MVENNIILFCSRARRRLFCPPVLALFVFSSLFFFLVFNFVPPSPGTLRVATADRVARRSQRFFGGRRTEDRTGGGAV